MDYIYYDLKRQRANKVLVVSLAYSANVRMMTFTDFISFKSGGFYRFYGRFVTEQEYKLHIPHDDHWIVVIDLGGQPGILQASAKIIDDDIFTEKLAPMDGNSKAEVKTECANSKVDTIIFCEGSPKGKNINFDSQCYNTIFSNEFPSVEFYSLGACSDVQNDKIFQVLSYYLSDKKLFRLIDRDDRSDSEITECQLSGVTVLEQRNLESYLLDDEILIKLCNQYDSRKIETVLAAKLQGLEASVQRRNAVNDVKSAAGDIVNALKKTLQLTNCGNNTFTFLRDTMAPLVTAETRVYQILKEHIFPQTSQ